MNLAAIILFKLFCVCVFKVYIEISLHSARGFREKAENQHNGLRVTEMQNCVTVCDITALEQTSYIQQNNHLCCLLCFFRANC